MASIFKIIPPRHLRQELLIKYHEGIGKGYLGFENFFQAHKTILLAAHEGINKFGMCKLRPLWFTKNNFSCAKRNVNSMAAGFPFESIAMDIVGPLPTTTRNNQYMLVVIDYYTRWPEAFTLQYQDAHSVAVRLISKIIFRYGAMYVIHTDQKKTNFESKLIAELCKLYDIKKSRTTLDHPQSDGQV